MVLYAPREWALFNFKQLRRGEEEERHRLDALNKKSIFGKLKQTKKRKPEEIGTSSKGTGPTKIQRNQLKSSETDEINEVNIRDHSVSEFYDNKYGIFDAASLIYYSDVHTVYITALCNHITVY